MARKQQPDKISHSRMQAIDDPTAAFPIGALSQLVDQDDDSGVYGRSSDSEPDRGPQHEEQHADEGDGSEESVEESEADAPSPSSPGAIQLGYLLLSLLGGGIAAALFAVVIVLAVLLL